MAKRTWTKSQNNAIKAKKGAVLVSAAAGSGKTAVLVERVLEILTDKDNPCDADKLLVVTFTKAAAAEMKERISARISEMIIAEPENKNLQRQQIMLSNAHISTIHSFCNELLKENFYELNLSSEFRIADENEMLILKDEAIQIVLEKKYEESSERFLKLVEIFCVGKDDKKIIDTVLTLYNFIRSHPFAEKWLEDKLNFYCEENNVDKTVFAQILFDYAFLTINHCALLTKNSLRLIEDEEKIKLAYKDTLLCDECIIDELKQIIESKNWDKISFQLKNTQFVALKRLSGYNDDSIKLKVGQNRKEVKDLVKNLVSIFFQTEAQCLEDLKELKPIITELFNLVREFSFYLDELKKDKNIVDFGDLEHLTLKLLVKRKGNGFEKTELAKNLSQQFKFVMVDEYQDTNEAQDLIFRAVSDEEKNLFVVGDVKQSIYGFRQAMPQIFLRRKQKYHKFDEEKETYPAKIILDKNFRSRNGILKATNFIFSQLMSKDMGEIEYNQEEKLVEGALFEEKDSPDVEIKIIDGTVNSDDSSNVLEARYIAETILKMIGEGYKIKDKDKIRTVTYGDFCILLRSANKHALEFVNELKKCGIPAWSDTSNSFFDTLEISVMISLLKVIDNPIQDVPLLSVMLSPVFGFTPDNLAEIRADNKTLPMYFAVKKHAEEGNENCKKFLFELDKFRCMASTLTSDRLIQYIYDETGYVAIMQSMDGGNLRLNNLHLLIEYARKYEASGYKGVTGFIRFISRLEEQNADISAANLISERTNIVKIMSIHRSKGLEFPICILANCARKFNKDIGDILLHPDLGPGIKLLDNKNMLKYTTFQREAIKLDIEKKAMSEELRVLYVAMTRAKEKLIMLMSIKNLESTVRKLGLQVIGATKLSPYVVGFANSFSDWILMCALRHPRGGELRKIANISPDVVVNDSTDLEIEIIKTEEKNLVVEEEKNINQLSQKVIDEDFLEKLKNRLNYVYKYKDLAKIPSKMSVSDLSSEKNNEIKFDFAQKPSFISEKKLTPAQVGSAMHAFLQFADLKKAKVDLETEIKFLLDNGFILKEQVEVLNRKQLSEFLNSDLCSRILNSKKVFKEFKFTVNISASEVVSDIKPEFFNENIVLQGAIDCVFEEKDNLILVDYKTDKTLSKDFLKENYRKQLDFYARALRDCTGKNVSEKILYSFYTGTQIFL